MAMNQRGEMTYVGREPAWHKNGEVFGRFLTWEEVLRANDSALDYDVFKSQLHDGLGRPVNQWGTFRWNRRDKLAGNKYGAIFLGGVGEGYQIIPHQLGMGGVDAVVKSKDGAHYATAGTLNDGAVVWGLADLNLSTYVGHDETKHYLLFTTSHDGTMSATFKDCAERVVCWNTLQIALSERTKNQLKVRHTKSGVQRMTEAIEALNSYRADLTTFEQRMQFLANRRVTRESLTVILDRIFPKRTREDQTTPVTSTRRDNILAEVLSLYEFNDNGTFPEQAGTGYALLNAVTAYTDHTRTGTSEREKSAMFGTGSQLKTDALSVILAEAEKMPSVGRGLSIQVDFADLGLNVPGVRSN